MVLGVEKLLSDAQLKKQLQGQSVALLCHAASVDSKLRHSFDLLFEDEKINLTAAFGPQHGIRAEKQDNMIESEDFVDPKYNLPIYSLYGEVRRPTSKMMESFDVLLVDMQDVGCRIYTFLTTLFYCMDECEKHNKSLWVLDRPNPAGRPVEGSLLDMDFETFVGAAPVPMRHGLTLGEAALWYKSHKNYSLNLEIVKMEGYNPQAEAWPKNRSWVNPSPNMPRLSCAQMYAGTVLLEGTLTSEGRGTTLPLEMFGAPGVDGENVLAKMQQLAPHWLGACLIRPCYFEPSFHKHQGELCGGLQIHTDCPEYQADEFKPYRIVAIYLRALKELYPTMELWRQPPYEYEEKHMPIDILSGNSALRQWVEAKECDLDAFDQQLAKDEASWVEQRKEFLIY